MELSKDKLNVFIKTSKLVTSDKGGCKRIVCHDCILSTYNVNSYKLSENPCDYYTILQNKLFVFESFLNKYDNKINKLKKFIKQVE